MTTQEAVYKLLHHNMLLMNWYGSRLPPEDGSEGFSIRDFETGKVIRGGPFLQSMEGINALINLKEAGAKGMNELMVYAKALTAVQLMASECISPKGLAEKAGVSQNLVYKWIKGSAVRPEPFGRICRALGVDPALVMDTKKMQERWGKREGKQ